MEIQRNKNEKIKKFMSALGNGTTSSSPREALEKWLEEQNTQDTSQNSANLSETSTSTGGTGTSTSTGGIGTSSTTDGTNSGNKSPEQLKAEAQAQADWDAEHDEYTQSGNSTSTAGAKQESNLETLDRAEKTIDQLHNEGRVSDEDYAKAKSDFAQKKLDATEKEIDRLHDEGKMSDEAYARAKSDIDKAKKTAESNQTGEKSAGTESTNKEESNGIERVKKGKDGKSVSQDDVTAAATGDNTINRGDTLWKYATQTGHSVTTLALINGIENPDLIYAGDTIDFEIDKENVKSAATSIQTLLDSLQAIKDNFNTGEVHYNSGGFNADVNGNSTRSIMDEIKREIEHNEETVATDAVNYREWLNKIIESLTAEEEKTYGVMGNTELLSINKIDG